MNVFCLISCCVIVGVVNSSVVMRIDPRLKDNSSLTIDQTSLNSSSVLENGEKGVGVLGRKPDVEKLPKKLKGEEAEKKVKKEVEIERRFDVEDEDGAVVSAEELEDTANRVQRVLNAFHEVTDVLSEVPRQLWMLPLRLGLLPGLKVSTAHILIVFYFLFKINFFPFFSNLAKFDQKLWLTTYND